MGSRPNRAKLALLLPHITFVASGVASKPTIRFSGVNVQIEAAQQITEAINGEGNLVIGYDENALHHTQTGSSNLILGEETFRSFRHRGRL